LEAWSWLVSRSGWSASSSSNTISRDFFARSDAVFTFMPAAAFRWHEAASTRSPFDLDHAGAAVAVGAIAGRRVPAQVRDFRALPFRHLPDGLAGLGLDLASVQREGDLGHDGRFQLLISISTKANSKALALMTLWCTPALRK
jgi:hypothetical protein